MTLKPLYTVALTLLTLLAFGQQSRISFLEYQQRYFTNSYSSDAIVLPTIEVGKSRMPDSRKKPASWIRRKLFQESFAILKDESGDFEVRANPIWNLQYGQEKNDAISNETSSYINGRGIQLDGHFLNQFYFQTGFLETQARFPSYLEAPANFNRSVPGVGRTKLLRESNSFDYGFAYGSFAYQPSEKLTIWVGNQPLFIGSGYRSMFYSDFAPNLPRIRTDLSFFNGKVNYSLVYGSLANSQRYGNSIQGSSITYSTEAALLRKPLTLSTLSFSPFEKLKITLLDASIWKKVENGRDVSVNPMRYSPIPLSGFLASDNYSVSGLQVDFQATKKLATYTQLIYSSESISGQVGAKLTDLIPNSFIQAEYNFSPYSSYFSTADSLLHYSHQSFALAHPLFTGFRETVFIFGYRFKSLIGEVKVTSATIDGDYTMANRADFINRSNLPVAIVGASKLLTAQPSLSWVINPETNFKLRLGAVYRKVSYGNQENNLAYVYLSVFTGIFNQLFDY